MKRPGWHVGAFWRSGNDVPACRPFRSLLPHEARGHTCLVSTAGYNLRCPDCDHPLIIVEYDQVEIDYCTKCRGCWLDEGELGLILTGDIYLPEKLDLVNSARGQRRCPHCRSRLRRGPLPESKVEVDACVFHHGMWLDSGELRQILAHHADGAVVPPLSRYLGKVFQHQVTTS